MTCHIRQMTGAIMRAWNFIWKMSTVHGCSSCGLKNPGHSSQHLSYLLVRWFVISPCVISGSKRNYPTSYQRKEETLTALSRCLAKTKIPTCRWNLDTDNNEYCLKIQDALLSTRYLVDFVVSCCRWWPQLPHFERGRTITKGNGLSPLFDLLRWNDFIKDSCV